MVPYGIVPSAAFLRLSSFIFQFSFICQFRIFTSTYIRRRRAEIGQFSFGFILFSPSCTETHPTVMKNTRVLGIQGVFGSLYAPRFSPETAAAATDREQLSHTPSWIFCSRPCGFPSFNPSIPPPPHSTPGTSHIHISPHISLSEYSWFETHGRHTHSFRSSTFRPQSSFIFLKVSRRVSPTPFAWRCVGECR